MSRPKKWKAGAPLLSHDDLARAFREKKMLWLFGRPLSAAFVRNMNYSVVTSAIASGRLRWAVETEEWWTWREAKAKRALGVS
jgi:hypothetical protein